MPIGAEKRSLGQHADLSKSLGAEDVLEGHCARRVSHV